MSVEEAKHHLASQISYRKLLTEQLTKLKVKVEQSPKPAKVQKQLPTTNYCRAFILVVEYVHYSQSGELICKAISVVSHNVNYTSVCVYSLFVYD